MIDWSLIVSVAAVVTAIALPLYFRHKDAENRLMEKRALLLQRILSLKSLNSSVRMQYMFHLHQHVHEMNATDKSTNVKMLEDFTKQEEDVLTLYEFISGHQEKLSSKEINKLQNNVNLAESVAADSLKFVETFFEAYK